MGRCGNLFLSIDKFLIHKNRS